MCGRSYHDVEFFAVVYDFQPERIETMTLVKQVIVNRVYNKE
jgi:hypothetical protein